MKYLLVFRKNGFVGLYDMESRHQLFNTTVKDLPNRLKLEFGSDNLIQCEIKIEGDTNESPIGLPIL